MSVSEDGTRGYLAIDQAYLPTRALRSDFGMLTVDLTQFQNREPDPVAEEISWLQWDGGSIPQSTIPITVDGIRTCSSPTSSDPARRA